MIRQNSAWTSAIALSMTGSAPQPSAEAPPVAVPRITFDKTVHDFGRITDTRKQTALFRFTNTGTGTLKVQDMKSSCGCTVPKLARKEFPPGDWRIASTASLLGAAIAGQGRFEEAETLLLDAEKTLRGVPPVYAYLQTEVLERLAALYEAWGRPDPAARWREQAERRKQ